MTARTWVYGRLTGYQPLVELVGDRVFAKKSMTSSEEVHPYLVYKLGNNTNESLAEDQDVSRQYLQIFVHDFADRETADYMLIDKVLKEIKAALQLGSSAEDGVITCQYLETSQDLNDETLNTVMKYIRFQLITKET